MALDYAYYAGQLREALENLIAVVEKDGDPTNALKIGRGAIALIDNADNEADAPPKRCPNGCHQTARWSEAFQEFIQGDTCDDCGAKMTTTA